MNPESTINPYVVLVAPPEAPVFSVLAPNPEPIRVELEVLEILPPETKEE